MEKEMRLKPAQDQLLVDNSNANNFHIGEALSEKLNNSDTTTSDTNSNSALNQNITNLASIRSEEWKGWEDNRQGTELNKRPPNLNSPDYAEVSTSSSGSSEEESSSDWEVDELPKAGFVNPNYPGFQHLANTEQTGFPRDISLDSLEDSSNPLTSVSDLTHLSSTPEEQEDATAKRLEVKEVQEKQENLNRAEDLEKIWREIRERDISEKVPCSLEQTIKENEEKSKNKWDESYDEDSLTDNTHKINNVNKENWEEVEFDEDCAKELYFEEEKDESVDNKELTAEPESEDESEKKDLEKDVSNLKSRSDDNNNEEEKVIIEGVNKFDETEVKEIYSKAKLNIPLEEDEEIKPNNMETLSETCPCPQECLRPIVKAPECAKTEYQRPTSLIPLDSSKSPVKLDCVRPIPKYPESCRSTECQRSPGKTADPCQSTDTNKLEKGVRESAPRKKEKTEINMNVKMMNSSQRSSPKSSKGSLDYKIETVMPQIDLDAIETHLRAAREEERRRRNEREEIRRRLATGDLEDLPPTDRPGKKPSLQSRLQSGMNLQICFMNDNMSDSESPSSDGSPHSLPPTPKAKSSSLRSLPPYPQTPVDQSRTDLSEAGRLQAEARAALSQAQGLARMQMHQERRRLQTSPITDMLRNSLRKVGVELAEGRRRLSRQLLTDMNVAQLQVIVNDLHTQIESLNEGLVKFLMERDELHMGQDSMLVDIEDLTRYLGAKENFIKEEMTQNNINQNNNNHVSANKPVITRIVSLGKK